PGLGFTEYMAFLATNKALVFVWHFVMYFINGACLVVLVPALYERLKPATPRLALIASAFGFLWTAFVFLSGVITNYGTEALLALHGKNQAQAEALKIALDAVTLGIDSSDRLLGGLWVGLASLAAFKGRTLPKAVGIFGMAIGAAGLVGTAIPSLVSIAYLFGFGAIFWWAAAGILMLRKRT
ncbi:MAG TPA: DUF4386 family protein, partial [Magnetospirillaceae bacterium]|nr:DUF4386 family protein [Magnetospirillaceae bacterium]